MSNDIKQKIRACRPCQAALPSQPACYAKTTKPSEIPTAPMSNAATDLFSIGSNQYITLVDRATGYLLAEQIKKTDSKTVISVLTRWFNTLGWPRTIKTDS